MVIGGYVISDRKDKTKMELLYAVVSAIMWILAMTCGACAIFVTAMTMNVMWTLLFIPTVIFVFIGMAFTDY